MTFAIPLLFLLPAASLHAAAPKPQPSAQEQALTAPIRGLNEKRLILPGIKAAANEYVSYAIYYWPDPAKPGGPYRVIDGKKNAELMESGDLQRLADMLRNVRILGDAYAKTHDKRYAVRAGQWLRHWFVNPKTKMQPHLAYSQIRPGHETSGLGGGIIDMANLPDTLRAISRLRRSPALTQKEWTAVDAWLRDYGRWLADSPAGQHERKTSNNHFLYYMAQRAAIASYLGDTASARTCLEEARSRMGDHIAQDGSQPHETKRAKGGSYSIYALKAWFLLAELGEKNGVDYWNYHAPNGASLAKAYAFLHAMAQEEKRNSPANSPQISDSSLKTMGRTISSKLAPNSPDRTLLPAT